MHSQKPLPPAAMPSPPQSLKTAGSSARSGSRSGSPRQLVEVRRPGSFDRSSAVVGSLRVDTVRSGETEKQRNIFHEEFNDAELGSLQFSLLYETANNSLVVGVLSCSSLPGRDNYSQELRNAFVKVYLLPEELCQQTRVVKGSNEPKFGECLEFSMDGKKLSDCSLRMSVYDIDGRQTRHSIGHLVLPLSCLNLEDDVEQFYQLSLEPLTNVKQSQLGCVEVALTYSNDGYLDLELKQCRDLQTENIDKTVATRCKITAQHMYARKNVQTKCTECVHLSKPVFQKTLRFAIPPKSLDLAHLILTLHTTNEQGTKSADYGQIHLGPFLYARGPGLDQWKTAIDNPRKQLTAWHQLLTPDSDSFNAGSFAQ